MKRKSVTGAVVASLALTALMTLAVSEKTRRSCEAQAERVRPGLRADKKEAFIANCLANATATQGRK
jgi:hypothetical protein